MAIKTRDSGYSAKKPNNISDMSFLFTYTLFPALCFVNGTLSCVSFRTIVELYMLITIFSMLMLFCQYCSKLVLLIGVGQLNVIAL